MYVFRFTLTDIFGDGWDTAKFILYDSSSLYHMTAPDCKDGPTMTTQYCFDTVHAKTGDYVTATVFGFNPVHPWEVRLTNVVMINDDECMLAIYTMIFLYIFLHVCMYVCI